MLSTRDSRRHVRKLQRSSRSAFTTSARPLHVLLLQIAVLLASSLPAAARAADESAVNAAIKEGVGALLGYLREQDEITYQKGTSEATVRGRVTKANRDVVLITTDENKALSIPRPSIHKWRQAGLVENEMDAPCAQGRSTLVALALAAAGVETTHPKMERLLAVLEDGPGNGGGTYVHSLRASLWSSLLDRPLALTQKNRFKKLLREDVEWLQRAGQSSGWYSYTLAKSSGDHSNTQFANLGLWSGSIGGAEVGSVQWQRMGRHWLETQNADGGWGYAFGSGQSTPSMTVAGCNSLYIALDRLYARPDISYKMFEGITIDKNARQRIADIHAALGRGDRFLEAHPPDGAVNSGYELFGMERLGLASGLAMIGGQDWFRAYAGQVCRTDWGENLIRDAFGVIFLVHGQAPILIQKLEHGAGFDDWNYYQRDLSNLVRFFNRTFERLHRWQRIPVNSPLRDMQDAPILYIAGSKALELPAETMQRLREYVDAGGTIFLHADRASRKFRDSAVKQFEELFSDHGWRFEDLAPDHPLYRCHFGGPSSPWKRVVPLKAVRDGMRLPIILCSVDIAGAWQQDRGPFEDLFRIMANVRVYGAPPYADLPRRLRPNSISGLGRPQSGGVRVARLASAAHPKAWAHFAETFRNRAGIGVEMVNSVDWTQADVVHVAADPEHALDDATIRRLREYVHAGGAILIDAIDGQAGAIEAAASLADSLAVGPKSLLPTDHPIISGTVPLAQALGSLETTEAGIGLRQGNGAPPILIQSSPEGGCVLMCPFDLTAGMDGCTIWKRVGYRSDSTRRLVENILLWRMDAARGKR